MWNVKNRIASSLRNAPRNDMTRVEGTGYFLLLLRHCKKLPVPLALLLMLATSAYAGLEVKRPDSPGLESGLVGYWSFDGPDISGTTATDRSGNGNNGTISNASKTTAKLGQGLSFNGSTGSVIVADTDNSLDATSAVTLSVWFYPRAFDTYFHVLVAKDGNNTSNYWLGHDGDRFVLTFGASGWHNHYTVNSYGLNQWYHVVGIIDSANDTMKIYVNGTLDIASQSETDNMSANNSSLHIGYDNGNNDWVNGIIDEVRVYNRALSEDEVQRLYTIGKGVVTAAPQQVNLASGLVGYWSFNGPDISGNIAYDRSGNGNNGTMVGPPLKVVGKLGQGFRFDGNGERVNANSAASLDNIELQGGGGMTVSAWIYPRTWGTSAVGAIAVKGANGEFGYWSLRLEGSNDAFRFLKDYQNTDLSMRSWGGIVLNAWQHVAVCWDGSSTYTNGRMYVNGQSVGFSGADGVGTKNSDAAENFYIGSDKWTANNFDGIIDELRIYNRALSVSEIQALYNQGAPLVQNSQEGQLTTGLVGYWPFNGPDISGSVAYDRSGQGNHGTFNAGGTQPFVQVKANSGTGTAVSATFDGTSPSGNLIVVGVFYGNSATCTISDTKSNTYTSAVGPTARGGYMQEIFYAKNITGGSPAITVTANLSSSVYTEIYIAEYTGMDTTAPLDQVSANTSPSSGLAVSGNKTTTQASEVIVGYCTSGACSEGDGFTARSRYNANVFEDRYVASINPYNASGTATSSWVIQMVTFKSSVPLSVASLVPGKVGQAIRFDGVDDYVQVTNSLSVPNQFTFSWWMKTTDTSGRVFGWSYSRFPYLNNTHKLPFTVDGNTDGAATTTTDVDDDQWHHIVFVNNGNNQTIYCDGIQEDTANETLSTGAAGIYFGSEYGSGGQYQGILDEIRMYNRALSAGEVKRLYNLGR